MQFAQLCFVNRARCTRQQALGTLCFGEGDDVADALCLGHERDQAVQPKRQAAVRWRAVLQGVQQETELDLGIFGRNLQCGEDLALHVGTVDTHRATAQFPAVQDHVVSLGDARTGVRVHEVLMAVFRRREGVMHSVPAATFFIGLEHRKVHHPQRRPLVFKQAVGAAKLAVAQLDAQSAQSVVHNFGLVGAEENEVTTLCPGARQDLRNGRVVQVLHDGALQAVAAFAGVVHLDPSQAPGAVDLDKFGVSVDLTTAQATVGLTAAGHAQGSHAAAFVLRRGREDFEVHVGHHVGEFGEFEVHAQVGLVRAITVHGLGVSHLHIGRQLHTQGLAEHRADHAFGDVADLLFTQKRGLDIDLRELGLAVCAQVFIAKALGDLVVTVKPRHHQQLLK